MHRPAKIRLLKEGVIPQRVCKGELARVIVKCKDEAEGDVMVELLDYGNELYGVGEEDLIEDSSS